MYGERQQRDQLGLLEDSFASEDEYKVEKIVGKSIIDGEVHYEVKWLGYSSKENTWEPIENLDACHEMIKEFEKSQRTAAPHPVSSRRCSSSNALQDKRLMQNLTDAPFNVSLSMNRMSNRSFQEKGVKGKNKFQGLKQGQAKPKPFTKSIELSSDSSEDDIGSRPNLRSNERRTRSKSSDKSRNNLFRLKGNVPSTLRRFNNIIDKYGGSRSVTSSSRKSGWDFSRSSAFTKRKDQRSQESRPMTRAYSRKPPGCLYHSRSKLVSESLGKKKVQANKIRADLFGEESSQDNESYKESDQKSRYPIRSQKYMGDDENWVPQNFKKQPKKIELKGWNKVQERIRLNALDLDSDTEEFAADSFQKDVPTRIVGHKFSYPLEGRFIDNLIFEVEWKKGKNGRKPPNVFKSRDFMKKVCPELLVEYYEKFMDYNFKK